MKTLFIISTNDGETICNAMRHCQCWCKKGGWCKCFYAWQGCAFWTIRHRTIQRHGSDNTVSGWFLCL